MVIFGEIQKKLFLKTNFWMLLWNVNVWNLRRPIFILQQSCLSGGKILCKMVFKNSGSKFVQYIHRYWNKHKQITILVKYVRQHGIFFTQISKDISGGKIHLDVLYIKQIPRTNCITLDCEEVRQMNPR